MLKSCANFALCVAAAAWVFGPPAAGQEPDGGELGARFLSEAPAAWSEYKRRAERFQGRSSGRTEVGGEVAQIEETSNEYQRNAAGESLVTETTMTVGGKEEYSATAYVVNRRYAFEARRPGPDSPWYLSAYVDLEREELPRIFERKSYFSRRETLRAMQIERMLLPDLIAKPTFEVLSCRAIERDSRELVQVAFQWPHAFENDEERSMLQGGEVLLDPRSLWTIVEYRVDLRASVGEKKLEGQEEFRVTDWKSIEGIAVPRRYELVHAATAAGVPGRRASTADNDFVVPSELPAEADFTLAAYGLPERPDSVPGVDLRFLWVAVFGLLCLMLAAFFLRRRKRTAGAATG